MWSWIKRRPAARGSAWLMRLQGETLTLQFGKADPVTLRWSSQDAQAHARLLAVLKQAARGTPPAAGQLRLEATGPDLAALQAVLEDAVGAKTAQAMAASSVGASALRQQLVHLPWRGLALLVIVFALSLVLPLDRAAVDSGPSTPAAPLAPLPSLAGQPANTPLGWLESLAQQAGASGAADWRLIDLRVDRDGTFLLRIQLVEAGSAPVMGSSNPGAAKLDALRQLLERQPGRSTVSVQAARSEVVLSFKPAQAASASPATSMVSADQLARSAAAAGLTQRPAAAPGVWVGPVQSIAGYLAQMAPAMGWSQLGQLLMERDMEQPGLAQVRLVVQPAAQNGGRP
jgi:hypothetical protein